MKRLLTLFAALVILLLVGLVAAYIYIDVIAKSAIERGSTYALGVNTTLKGAGLKVFQGQLTLNGLNVANPSGFNAPHFLTMDDGDVAVTLGSLRQDVVHVEHLKLSQIDVNLQKQGAKSNYQAILDNLKKLESDKPAPGKGYMVKELEIRNVMLHVDLIGGGDLTRVNVPIDQVRLQNVGSDTPRGVLLSDLAGVIIKAILAAAADKGGGLIPPDILGDLKGQLAQLQDLEKIADVKSLGEIMKPVGEMKELESIKNFGEKATEGVGKKIGDLFGERKDK